MTETAEKLWWHRYFGESPDGLQVTVTLGETTMHPDEAMTKTTPLEFAGGTVILEYLDSFDHEPDPDEEHDSDLDWDDDDEDDG